MTEILFDSPSFAFQRQTLTSTCSPCPRRRHHPLLPPHRRPRHHHPRIRRLPLHHHHLPARHHPPSCRHPSWTRSTFSSRTCVEARCGGRTCLSTGLPQIQNTPSKRSDSPLLGLVLASRLVVVISTFSLVLLGYLGSLPCGHLSLSTACENVQKR